MTRKPLLAAAALLVVVATSCAHNVGAGTDSVPTPTTNARDATTTTSTSVLESTTNPTIRPTSTSPALPAESTTQVAPSSSPTTGGAQSSKTVKVPDAVPLWTTTGTATSVPSPSAVLPDGRLIDMPVCDHDKPSCTGDVSIVDTAGNRQTLGAPFRPGVAFPHFFAFDDHNVVWVADPDQDLIFTAWEIWAAPIDHPGTAHKIAQAEPNATGVMFFMPRTDNGIVVWSTTMSGASEPSTYMVPADGSKPAVELESTSFSAEIIWPYVFMQKHVGNTGKNLRVDLRDGKRDSLDIDTLCYFRAGGQRLVCQTKSHDIILMDATGKTELTIQAAAKGRIVWPEVGTNAVVWDDGIGAAIMLIDTGKIGYLTRRQSNQISASGSLVWWYDSTSKQTMVFDTATGNAG